MVKCQVALGALFLSEDLTARLLTDDVAGMNELKTVNIRDMSPIIFARFNDYVLVIHTTSFSDLL